jgi:Protein of unknown function (DUF3014)
MPDPSQEHRTSLRRSRLPLIALPVLVVAGAVAFFLYQRGSHEPPAQPPSPVAAPEPGGAGTVAGEANLPPPVLDEARIRALLESLSPFDLFRRWLAEGDPVRRWAVVTDNIAEDTSPRRELALFAPSAPFSVASKGGKLVIAPESYRRYDRFADAIAAVDAQTAASVYRALRGSLGAAYRALGYPDRSFDRVTAKALSRLERAPVREGPVEVVDEGGVYLFADRELEGAGDVEKHLLRMGPRNARIVQAKAKEVREALGLAAELRAP